MYEAEVCKAQRCEGSWKGAEVQDMNEFNCGDQCADERECRHGVPGREWAMNEGIEQVLAQCKDRTV